MDIKKEKKKTVMRGAAIWLENFPLTQEKYPKVNSNLVLVFLKSEGDRKHLLTCDVQSLFPVCSYMVITVSFFLSLNTF